MIKEYILLNSGYRIPTVGLGTYKMSGLDLIKSTIRCAVSMGYRHIDTAYKYANEEDIGTVLQELFVEGTLKREDVFITSKLWCTHHKDPERALDASLGKLKLEYLDLYLVHFPVTYKLDVNGNEVVGEDGLPVLEDFDAVSVWQKMEALLETGKVRSIGVSNFGLYNLNRLLESCNIKPAVAQFELHPYLKQTELVNFCKRNGVVVTAYSSLGSTRADASENIPLVKQDEKVVKVAKKCGKTTSQVILSYLVQKGAVVIPKSTSPVHLKENMDLFVLDPEDEKVIDQISICYRYNKPKYLGKDAFK